jgi:hypothetical protein
MKFSFFEDGNDLSAEITPETVLISQMQDEYVAFADHDIAEALPLEIIQPSGIKDIIGLARLFSRDRLVNLRLMSSQRLFWSGVLF